MNGLLLKLSISTAAGFFFGKYFFTAYKDRRMYYSGLVDFIGVLANNLAFRQEKLPVLVKEYSAKTNDVFKLQLENFYDYICDGREFGITCNRVVKDRAPIENFFKNIGTVDLFTQKEALISYKNEFGEKLKASEIDEKKKGMSYLKLCTLAGLAAGILLL